MVVAYPPKKAKQKSGSLLESIHQHTLDDIIAASPAEGMDPPVPTVKAQPIHRQLDFDALIFADDVNATAERKPAASRNAGVSQPVSRRRGKVKKQAGLPAGIKQASFDELFITTSPVAFTAARDPQVAQDQQLLSGSLKPLPTGEMYRPAPRRRNKVKKQAALPDGITQSSFDTLFASISGEATGPTTPTIEAWRDHERARQDQQHHSDALAELSPKDVPAIPAGEPLAGGTGDDGAAVLRPALRADGGAEDGIPASLGDSSGAIPSARRTGRRRVLLDEPEPAGPSRDFRITDAHGVGSGGLHEKANANIAAIRLLKTLEEENREATDTEKAVLVRYAGWGALAGVLNVIGIEDQNGIGSLQN